MSTDTFGQPTPNHCIFLWHPFFSSLSTLINFLLFFREARDLLNNFVTLYVDGNSCFLDKTFQGTFLPLEVAIHFLFLEFESKVDLVLCFYCKKFCLIGGMKVSFIQLNYKPPRCILFQLTSPWRQTQLISLLTATLCSARREVFCDIYCIFL